MMAKPLTDLSKLCLHTITLKSWNLDYLAAQLSQSGIGGVSVWRDTLQDRNIYNTGQMLRSHGLEIVSLVRGGFFPSADEQKRKQAIDENKMAIDEAAALECPMIVLVCGADPGQSLDRSLAQIKDGIETIVPYAKAAGVKLAIEPLHPMYADTRSAINTMKRANEVAEYFQDDHVGVAVDVYHLWWDPDLKSEILRCGKNNNLFAFHICDWLSPTVDMLNDRGLMGEGCIDVRQIRGWVEQTGFDGYHEVEVFSERWWESDQHTYFEKIKQAYLRFS